MDGRVAAHPSLLRSISFHLLLLIFLPRLAEARPYSNVRRRRTEADENRITRSELETGEEAEDDSLLRNEARRK